MIAPLARTTAEARLYMDVKPCPSCRGHGFTGTSVVMLLDGRLYERHTGACQECGADREFVFRVPPDEQLTLSMTDFGGPEPSELLDPGEWLTVADLVAGREGGAGPTGFAIAAAAVDEVLKFVPAGAEEIPRTAFHSPEGREAYLRRPERFRRGRLEALAAALHEAANEPVDPEVDTPSA